MKNRLDYFEDFVLNENKKNKEIKILLLSNISEESSSVEAINKQCKKRGIECIIIDINSCFLEKKKENRFTITDKNKISYNINSDNTAIITRRGVIRNTHTKEIVQDLQDSGFFVINTLESISACENKYTTTKILKSAGIPVPRTAIIDKEDSIDRSVKQVGGKFPLILKMLSGSQGIGVSIVDSFGSLKSVLQTIWKIDPNVETLIQEKIESEYDLRIHVLNRKFNSPRPEETDSVILGFMKRNKIKNDFRTNYSLGGSVEKTKITDEQKDLAIRSAKAVGCNWCGVDIIVDKKTGKNYVLEVNSSPGTQGLKKATGIDVVKDIIDYIADKENWTISNGIIGFREVVNIPEIGDIVAKFDTGNGSLSSSLTCDRFDIIDNKFVEWELGDKKFKNKIIEFVYTEVGKETHKRPVIYLDLIFKGSIYKDVEISLVDRTEKSTKMLINRKLMQRMGYSISPNKTFIATSFPEEYSPKEAKGDNYAGIKFK